METKIMVNIEIPSFIHTSLKVIYDAFDFHCRDTIASLSLFDHLLNEEYDIYLFCVLFSVQVEALFKLKPRQSCFNGALLTVYLYMLYPIATFQKAGTCLDDHQSMAKQQHGETANQKLCE